MNVEFVLNRMILKPYGITKNGMNYYTYKEINIVMRWLLLLLRADFE